MNAWIAFFFGFILGGVAGGLCGGAGALMAMHSQEEGVNARD